jgi:signal transduction histidine kinase
LGLAIARWIAAAHGGTLKLQRSDATGTTFIVTLPTSCR